MNYVSSIGLVLDIIGVIFIFIASEKLNNSLSKLIEEASRTIGFWQDNPLDENLFSYLNESRKLSSILNKLGLFILIIGFSCQFLGALFTTT